MVRLDASASAAVASECNQGPMNTRTLDKTTKNAGGGPTFNDQSLVP